MKYALLYKNGTTSSQFTLRKSAEDLAVIMTIAHSRSYEVVGILIIKPKTTNKHEPIV